MKQCNKCRQEKAESEFYVDSRSKKVPKGRMPACKICVKAANRAWAQANPKKVTARSKAWRARNPGRASKISRAWQLRHPEQFKAQVYQNRYKVDFTALWDTQDGKCAACQDPMLREGKTPESVCVDHDRACCPGKKSCGRCVRGLIHRNCNLVIGYAKDNAGTLRKAAAYLEDWEARFSVNAASEVNDAL